MTYHIGFGLAVGACIGVLALGCLGIRSVSKRLLALRMGLDQLRCDAEILRDLNAGMALNLRQLKTENDRLLEANASLCDALVDARRQTDHAVAPTCANKPN